VKIAVAAVQMHSELLDVPANLQRADDLLRIAHQSNVELAVLPELFNTGYSLCPDFGPFSETADGPTLTHLRQRSRQ
jgi:predicted amidohydrolase